MTDERLRLTAEMRDRLSPQLRRLKTVIESTGRVGVFQKLAKDMSLAERAGYRFGFVMGRTIRFGALAAAAGTVAVAGAAVVAGGAFVKFGKDAADAMDENAALAKQIGISADSLRTLQGVATRYNVTQEGLSAGLIKFNVNFGRLKQNQGAFYTYLSKTNPALATQFKQVGSTGDAFLLLSDAISKTADPAKRAALIKAAGLPQEFLRFFADGPDDLRDTIKQVIRFQGILGPKASEDAARYGDNLDNIGLAWKGLRDKLAVAALPVVNPLLEDLANYLADNRERISTGFKEIAGDVGAAMRDLGKWVNSDKGREFFSGLWPELQKVGAAFRDIALSVKELVGAVKGVGGWPAVLGALVALKMGGGGGGFKGLLLAAGALLWDAPHPKWMDQTPGEALSKLFGGNGKEAAPALSSPFNKSNIAPDVLKRANDAANAFRADPEGTRGRVMQQRSDDEINAAAKALIQIDAMIKQLQESGGDKREAKKFADLVAERNAVAANVALGRATDIGKKIGTEAGNSFFDQMMLRFQGISYQGGGEGSGGARMWAAAYNPAGVGGGFGGPRANGVGGSFTGKGMLDLIAAAEGTGNNYNETLGYGRFTGGKVNLTGMTLDQIDALQSRMLQHPGNSFNSSALGRYQFTRTRLRDLRKRFNLPGSAVFNKETQDALARASLAERGGSVGSLRNEWEGLRRVPNQVLQEAMRNHRRQKREERQKVEGSADVNIRFPNGVPPGTKVGAQGKGLFREVNLDTGRTMKEAAA